ncbi:MAG: HNH endonuclease signature motif containing protein [Bdellovibrionota bacterium]
MSTSLAKISNEELTQNLKRLVKQERELTHRIVLHLAEMSSRRLYAELGYTSMFDYACRALGYSRSSAQRRIVAARIVARFPEVYDCLEDGRLSLGTLESVADAMDRPNARELLCELSGKSKDEVQRIVAYHLPIEPSKLADKIEPVCAARTNAAVFGQASMFEHDQNSSYSRAGVTTILPTECSEELYRISFTASAPMKAKLERAQELLEAYDVESVLDRALDEFLSKHCPKERLKRRKAREERRLLRQGARIVSAVDTVQAVAGEVVSAMPAAEADPAARRFPSLKLRDEVLERDGHQCTYEAPDGTRCCATGKLELDHRIPWAYGGRTELGNLRTVCRAHNHMFARKFYGDYYIDQILDQRKPDECGRPTVPPPTGAYNTGVHRDLFE